MLYPKPCYNEPSYKEVVVYRRYLESTSVTEHSLPMTTRGRTNKEQTNHDPPPPPPPPPPLTHQKTTTKQQQQKNKKQIVEPQFIA